MTNSVPPQNPTPAQGGPPPWHAGTPTPSAHPAPQGYPAHRTHPAQQAAQQQAAPPAMTPDVPTVQQTPRASGPSLAPTVFGWLAAAAVALMVLFSGLRSLLFLAVAQVSHFAIVNTGLNILFGLIALAAAVLGMLGFFRSGRRDVIAFGAAAVGVYGIVSLVLTVITSMAVGFLH